MSYDVIVYIMIEAKAQKKIKHFNFKVASSGRHQRQRELSKLSDILGGEEEEESTGMEGIKAEDNNYNTCTAPNTKFPAADSGYRRISNPLRLKCPSLYITKEKLKGFPKPLLYLGAAKCTTYSCDSTVPH
eukprot:scaffold410_cov153-Skeletonema_dohrnii-CCMP3373.AAC.2